MNFHRRDNHRQVQATSATYHKPIAAQQKADTSDGLVNDSVKLELNLMPERLFVPLEE